MTIWVSLFFLLLLLANRNKSDLESSRQVSYREGRALARSWDVPFMETRSTLLCGIHCTYIIIYMCVCVCVCVEGKNCLGMCCCLNLFLMIRTVQRRIRIL